MFDEVVPTCGVLLHDQGNWPCAVCRPARLTAAAGSLLCVSCAQSLVVASLGLKSLRFAGSTSQPSFLEFSETPMGSANGLDLIELLADLEKG